MKDHFKFDDDIVANKKVHEIILGLVMDNLATAAASVDDKDIIHDNDVLEMNIDVISGDGEGSGVAMSNGTSMINQRKNRMFYEPYTKDSNSHQQYINPSTVHQSMKYYQLRSKESTFQKLLTLTSCQEQSKRSTTNF